MLWSNTVLVEDEGGVFIKQAVCWHFWGWKRDMQTWQAVKNQENTGKKNDEFTENKSQIFNKTSQSILQSPSGSHFYFSCWDTIVLNSFVILRDSWVRKLFKNTNPSLMNEFNISSVNLTHFMNPNIPKDSWHSTSVFPTHSLAYNHLDNLVKHIFPDRRLWNKSPGISIFNKQSRSFLCSQTEIQT